MTLLRRVAQIVAFVGTLLVGIIALALIVSQTSWFREWVRRYIVREAKQYLNGELTIGRISGNLFFGAELTDISVVVAGERIIAVKDMGVDYSVLDLISSGLVLDDIRINEPRVVLRRTADGWNLGRLVKEQRKEADREGPARPVAIGSIGISSGDFALEGVGTSGVDTPRRLQKIDAKLSFHYAPVHYTVDIDHLSFRAVDPGLDLNQLKGTVAVRNDDLYFEDLVVRTAESDLRLNGVVESYLRDRVIKIEARSDKLSLPELARLVPALGRVRLQPALTVNARGPLDRLGLELDVRSSAGAASGGVTVDLEGPRRAAAGTLNLRALDLAGLTGNPDLRSRITGKATFDLHLPPGGIDALGGRFAFTGPGVTIAGYEASDVRVAGRLAGPRVEIDGRAQAYGGASTARGVIIRPGVERALAFDLRGSASGVDLRRLPASLRVPRLATALNADWHAEKRGAAVTADAILHWSVIEGATFAEGTTARVATEGADRLEYAAKGAVSDLDLQRFGRALEVDALKADRFASRLTGPFDVRGSGRTIDALTLDASGELIESRLFGGELPTLAYTARIDRGSLSTTLKGTFAGFDPAALSGRAELKGRLAGSLDVDVRVDDVRTPIQPEQVMAAGRVELAGARVGTLDIEKGRIEGRVDRGAGEIRTLDVSGPDVHLTASGPIALTDAGQSNLEYHFDTPSLEKIGQLVGQPLGGAVTLDGHLTGNRAELKTTGALEGSNVRYGDNGALDLTSQYAVTLPDLSAARARIESTATAAFVKAGGLDLREVAAKTTYVGQQLDFDAKVNDRGRELQATGSLIVHTDHDELHLPSLALRSQGIQWTLAGPATVQFDPREIRLKDVHLVNGQQSLEVEGTIARTNTDREPPGLSPAGDARRAALTVKATDVDLAQLERLTLQERGLAGRLSADTRLTGSLDAPRVEGSVAIANGKFRTFSFESLTTTVDYTGSGIRLDARLQQNATQWLTAKGYAPMMLFRAEPGARAEHVAASGTDRVDLRIESSPIDLGVVQGFTSHVTDVKGTLQANVRVTGSGHDPHLEGAVEIHGGAFKVPLGGVSYTGLDTTLDFHEDRVTVSGFELRDDHGDPLLVSGEIAVHERQVGTVDLGLQAESFELIDNELGDVEIDGRLHVTGELRRPKVEGSVKLEAGRLEVDRLLQEFAADPYATEAAKAPEVEPGVQVAASGGGAHQATEQSLDAAAAGAARYASIEPVPPLPAAPQPGIVEQLALDVHVVIPDNLVLRGADLRPAGRRGLALGNINVTIGGDLRVRKTPGDRPRLFGAVNTVRGFYEFQGRRFEVARDGRIRFTGEADLNPLIDVTATREISGVIARVHIQGSARAPELALSSSPPLDEADILSLIVFNTSLNGLGTGEKISLAQRAGAIASGFVAAPLAKSIGQAFDLDLFEIETTSDAGEFGANVTLGQQVSEHLFVKLRQQFGPQDASEFIMEYQLAKFLRFRGSAAPGGGQRANRTIRRRVERGAADLIFFFSY